MICHAAMSHFIPEADIRARDEDSKRIAREIGKTLEDYPPRDMIADFACHFADLGQEGSSYCLLYTSTAWPCSGRWRKRLRAGTTITLAS